MNFEKLPRSIIDSILEKANIESIAKLSQTCSTVNKIIKMKQLDKIDVGHISFTRKDDDEFSVTIDDCEKFSEELKIHGFEQSYVIESAQTAEDLQNLMIARIRQVLNSIKSAVHVEFACFLIDESFVQMLKEMSIQWSKVTARFVTCSYLIPKSKCLSLWKMFKSADDTDGHYQENDIEVINDEMMLQTLPSITFSTDRYDVRTYQENPNITDRTLAILDENRPARLIMGKFISNFTVDGIMQLFRKIAHSRDSNVDEWFIGGVRLDFLEFRRFFEEISEFETDYSTVLGSDMDDHYGIVLVYKKENSDERTCLCVDLLKPQEVLEAEMYGNNDGEVYVEIDENNNEWEF